VAVLVRVFGDIDLAEDAVQDAFAAAAERWPSDGLPPSTAGWIITTARNRAIDRLRRESVRSDKHAQGALVLAVLYLIFNEGYAASAGEALVRTELCAEGIRLARLVTQLMPDEPEATGLLALMLLTDARRATRTSPAGDLVLLSDQDRRRRDRGLIEEGQTSSAAACDADSQAPTRSRRRSTRSTATPRPRRTPTGARSSRSTTS
jgi:predicted RNA polymerase sigma factor